MPEGKLASQTGHAYVESFLQAKPDTQVAYRKDGLGTKICLKAKNLGALLRLEVLCIEAGLPHALITDTGRNTTFGGVDTVSAIGVGPLTPEQATILKRFKLL
jgi:peptidyl-tRNA hydrolase